MSLWCFHHSLKEDYYDIRLAAHRDKLADSTDNAIHLVKCLFLLFWFWLFAQIVSFTLTEKQWERMKTHRCVWYRPFHYCYMWKSVLNVSNSMSFTHKLLMIMYKWQLIQKRSPHTSGLRYEGNMLGYWTTCLDANKAVFEPCTCRFISAGKRLSVHVCSQQHNRWHRY